MDTIHVHVGQEAYDVFIEEGLRHRLGEPLANLTRAHKVAVVTEEAVKKVYGNDLVRVLSAAGLDARLIALPSGERTKSLHVVSRIYDALADFDFRDTDALVALGGRIVGDVTGFVAATYRRGVAYVQVPTSVVSQIGSAIGGKISIDIPGGKNLVGAYYQPKAVFIDPLMAKTLPPRYFYNGLGEAVKYGCVADATIFELLEKGTDPEEWFLLLPSLIRRCVAIKAEYVTTDSGDRTRRRILDFGHLIGNAIERYYRHDESRMTPGEATAIGMVLMTRQSEKEGFTASGTTERLVQLLQKLHLPVDTDIPFDVLFSEVCKDKKIRDGKVEVALLRSMGEGILRTLTLEELKAYVEH